MAYHMCGKEHAEQRIVSESIQVIYVVVRAW
jgi:hypothetical protein